MPFNLRLQSSAAGTLDTRLASFHADATALEISVKDRESRGQKVTLECWIGGREKIVTTPSEEDLHTAVMDVRNDLRRRLNDAKTRQEPRHNRHLRDIAQLLVGGGAGFTTAIYAVLPYASW
ncbi:MAG TPA: HPF/RaiA family ribosome-associated protein [Candidatus Dormibacteraeota bacterium]